MDWRVPLVFIISTIVSVTVTVFFGILPGIVVTAIAFGIAAYIPQKMEEGTPVRMASIEIGGHTVPAIQFGIATAILVGMIIAFILTLNVVLLFMGIIGMVLILLLEDRTVATILSSFLMALMFASLLTNAPYVLPAVAVYFLSMTGVIIMVVIGIIFVMTVWKIRNEVLYRVIMGTTVVSMLIIALVTPMQDAVGLMYASMLVSMLLLLVTVLLLRNKKVTLKVVK